MNRAKLELFLKYHEKTYKKDFRHKRHRRYPRRMFREAKIRIFTLQDQKKDQDQKEDQA